LCWPTLELMHSSNALHINYKLDFKSKLQKLKIAAKSNVLSVYTTTSSVHYKL
jgi:hypothetical protein